MRNPPDVPGVRSQRTRFQKLLAYLKRYWFLYLLVLPGFVFMIVFNYGPMYGIQLAADALNLSGRCLLHHKFYSPHSIRSVRVL